MAELALSDILEAVAVRVPDRPAIVWRDRVEAYGELVDRTRALARVFLAAGLGEVAPRGSIPRWRSGQDHVAVYMRNRPEWLEAMFGAFRARLLPFNVNYRYTRSELARLLDAARPRALVYEAEYAPLVEELRADVRDIDLLLHVDDGSGHGPVPGAVRFEDAIGGADGSVVLPACSPDDGYLLFTGGTTGMPKGVLWRQGDIRMAALGGRNPRTGSTLHTLDDITAAIPPEPRPTLPAPPFMHGGAQWNACTALLGGDTVVVQGVVDHLDPDDVWQTVERHRVKSLVIAGNAFARPLLTALEERSYDVSCLRLLISGAVALTPDLKEALLRALPGVVVLDSAGSSETGTQLVQASRGSVDGASRFAPVEGTCVVSDDRATVLAPGDPRIGWLARTGDVPLAYLDDEVRTRETFPEVAGRRYAIPGDRARVAADGSIELLGRDSATINSGGEKIFAEEVERAIAGHPSVYDVVVVGRPSERWGHEVVAVVRLRPGQAAGAEELREAAAASLARFKLPKAFVFVDAVRRSPAGKPDYTWALDVARGTR